MLQQSKQCRSAYKPYWGINSRKACTKEKKKGIMGDCYAGFERRKTSQKEGQRRFTACNEKNRANGVSWPQEKGVRGEGDDKKEAHGESMEIDHGSN